ncbi:winged helix-turn-helix domain-containing protein [Sphingomicrobium nitratireducens]|uniref:winged helix-turn-helix domain-containing protein n=1 Tax=Sphingomicrobium nitratireducens TaxID=2964666 RepID=UPI00223F40E9|nr:transcriptional regulator [Sphingomicrobium nitratireducens]
MAGPSGGVSPLRFGDFTLDIANRRLLDKGAPVDLNARYLDALALMAQRPGDLVTKDEFLDTAWNGVPVTDEALTQAIRKLRQALGDDANAPRYIETVPKHGYRFIAPVESADTPAPAASRPATDWLGLAASGTIGGGMAGLLGGLLYGLGGTSQPLAPGMGAASVLVVLVSLNILVGLAGGAGVSAGIALAHRLKGAALPFLMAGGAIGGLLVGTFARLLGIDAFTLLFGQAPARMTGGFEGSLLGLAVGVGAWAALRPDGLASPRRAIGLGAASGAFAGLAIALFGGTLMAGSLAALSRNFDGSRLDLDRLAHLVGEAQFGPLSTALTAALEGLLFGGCIAAALLFALRQRA